MIRFHTKSGVALTLLGAGALLLGACGTESDDAAGALEGSEGSGSAMSYNGPGSVWDVELDDGDFTITMRENLAAEVALTITGDYVRHDSGFLVFTVGDSLGTDGPSAGDQAWAIEVPGYALLLKPMAAGSDQLIPMVSAGSCPDADFQANWVIVKKASDAAADDADRDFFGTFAYTAATGTASLPSRRALANDFQDGGAANLTGGDCAEGIMSVEDAVMYLTSNGGAIVHTGVSTPADSSFIFALTQKAIADTASLDGEYAGVLFDESSADGEKIAPVALECSAGICSGTLVTDVVTGATSPETVTVTLSGTADVLGNGLVTGTIASGADSGNLACMADNDVLGGGRKMISCVGQSPGDNANMFNVLFVSKDAD